MISEIKFKSYKCFEECSIPLRGLTILAGANGCGKSTVIQALLMIRQSYERSNNLDRLIVSGEYINLGTTSDIINENTESTNITFQLKTTDDTILDIQIPYESNRNWICCNSNINKIDKTSINLLNDNFEYIAADRISPANIFSSINFSHNLGIHGEKVFSYLAENGMNEIIPELVCSDVPNTLINQANVWLQKMFHGFKFNIQEIIMADSISLRYQEVSRTNSSNEYRPINVGFGITYVLPVIIALLKAKENDLVIIENPECHLHPKAQRMIGELIAQAVEAGIQVVLETHSDHILNGIRIAAKKQIIDNNKVQIIFFDREDVGVHFNTNVYAPNLLKDGSLDYWPDGFFDEWDNALTELL